MSKVKHVIPIPCAVYTRARHVEPYVFSHMVTRQIVKELPASLAADDVRALPPPNEFLHRALRSPILVLVAGDAGFSAALREAIRSARSPSWIKKVEVVDLPEAVHSSGKFILDNLWNSRGHALVAETLLARLRRH